MSVELTDSVATRQDTDLITVRLTVGTAKALLSALTQSAPPPSIVAKNASLALVRSLSSPTAKGKGIPPTTPPPRTTPPPKTTPPPPPSKYSLTSTPPRARSVAAR